MAADTVQEIKDRLSIREVVAPYVKLTQAGRSLVGLCPFHKEKTPSFHVSLERGTYHCFGCGEGGDMFSFIQKTEGVDFKEALKMLAEKAGVRVEYAAGSQEIASHTERLRAALARATEWYRAQFAGSPAETYALQRGLSVETIRDWRLGYAPSAWRALLEALSLEGFTTRELMAAGLVKEADGKPGTYYDRFRARLMFPIGDATGRIVGFTGRALSADEPAKYLNSPETDLYRKSEIVFGIDRAKDAIRTRRFTLLVEGQMDALLAHQAGFNNAVALSGTALSERHLELMKRYSDNLMLVLDADAAGLSATAKSAILALSHGLRVKAAQLPEGKDPADVISEDPKDFAERVKAAKPVVEFFLAALSSREHEVHRLLSAAERMVLPLIGAIPSPMEREHFIQTTARTLGLSSEAVRESVKRLPKEALGGGGNAHAATSRSTPPAQSPSAVLQRAELLLAVLHAYPNTPLAMRVETEYRRITEALPLPPSAPDESTLFKAERVFGETPAEGAADELLRAFEEAVIREAYQKAVADLRRAESAGDSAGITTAEATCAKLAARRASLT